jgi:hypothetical protein
MHNRMHLSGTPINGRTLIHAFGRRVTFSCSNPVQSMCRAGPFAGDARGRYRLPPDGFAGVPPLPWFAKGEVGIASFGLSFFGFFASRLPRCSPLAMASLRLSVSSWLGSSHSWVELSSRWSKSALTRSISLRRRRSLASKLCAKRPSR